jgi:hypothetical protein
MQHSLQNPTPQGFSTVSTNQQEAKQTAKPEKHFRAFCTYYDGPVDILNNAASIISFLEDVTPSMIENGGNLGLSQDGMNGLSIIYMTLRETIQAAIEATGKQEVTA